MKPTPSIPTMVNPRLEKALSHATFNEERVKELKDMGDQEFLDDMLEDFIEQVYDGLDELSALYESKEWLKLADKAHFLKGSSLALGCEQLGHIFEVLQHLRVPTKEDIDFIGDCLDQAEKTWEETLPIIDSLTSVLEEETEGGDK